MSNWLATGLHAMVDTRSTLLIDDGIGMQSDLRVTAGGRHRLEQTHMATTHQFDGNPRVCLDQLIRALAENAVFIISRYHTGI